jgi:hypothetical protein
VVHTFQNACQARTSRNMMKYSSEIHAEYLIHLPLSPYPHFPAELASILLLAFSVFALVAAVSQCLCSETPYLSINFTVFMYVTRISCYIQRSVLSAVSRNRVMCLNVLPVDTGALLYFKSGRELFVPHSMQFVMLYLASVQ